MPVGTVRLGSYNAYSRHQIASTVIPLAQGTVYDGARPDMRALDVYGPGQHVGVQYSQPTRYGIPKHPDGSWKIARAHFPVLVEAGVSGRFGYAQWADRDVTIELGQGTLPTFAQHAAIDLSRIRLRMQVHARDQDYTGTPPVREVEWTPLSGHYNEYASPYTLHNPDRAEHHDTIGGTRRWIRAYEVHGRILPEAIDNNAARATQEPSFVGRFLYEVPDGSIPGWGRVVRWWFELCYSDTTLDAVARSERGVRCRLLAPPTLDITTTDVGATPIRVTPGLRRGWQPVLTALPDGARMTLYEPARWSGGDGYCYGTSRVYRGTIFFEGGASLTPEEIDVRNAIEWNEGEQQWCGASSIDWPDHESYGIFGVVPKPEEFGWNNRDEIRNAQAPGTRINREYYVGQNAWPPFPRHNAASAPGQPGGQPNLGNVLLVDFAMAGHPEEGGVWLSATCDGLRRSWMVNPDGTTFDVVDPVNRKVGTPASTLTSFVGLDGLPKWSSNWTSNNLTTNPPGPAWAEHGGKGREVPRNPGGYQSYKNSHCTLNTVVFAGFLFADRWVMSLCFDAMRNVCFMAKPNPSANDLMTFTGTDVGTGSPREIGRPMRSHAHMYSLSGDPLHISYLATRTVLLRTWGFTEIYPGPDSQANLLKEVPCIVEDSGYPADLRVDCSQQGDNLDPIWYPPGQSGRHDWSSWQNGLMMAGIYAGWLAMRKHDSVTYAAQIENGREVLQVMSKGMLEHTFQETSQGGLRATYNQNYNWDPNQRGRAISLADQLDARAYCTAVAAPPGTPFVTDRITGTLRPRYIRVGGPGGLYGRSTGANFWPLWKENDGFPRVWAFGGYALAGIFNPGDSEVDALLADRMVARRVFPSESQIRATLLRYADSWFQWGCIIPNFSRRWLSGPITRQGSASGTIGMVLTAGDQKIRWGGPADATVSMVLTASAPTIHPVPIEGGGIIRSGSAEPGTIGMVLTAAQNIIRASSAGMTAGMVLTAASDRLKNAGAANMTIGMTLTGNPISTRGIGGGGGTTPPPTIPPSQPQTLRDALGPRLERARGARVMRNGDGTLTRISFPLTYKSGPPRGDYPRRDGNRST